MIGQQTYDEINEFCTGGPKTSPDVSHFNNGYGTGEGYPKQHHNFFMNNFSKNGGKYQAVLTSLVAEMLNILTEGGLTYNASLSTQIFTALNNVFSNASNLASGTINLARIPATLTGKDADTLDSYHAKTFLDTTKRLQVSNWLPLSTNPFTAEQISAMAINSIVTVLAGGFGGTISRSLDLGRTWSNAITNPFGSDSINCIAYGNNVFVAGSTDSHISRSTDNGATWSAFASNPLTPYLAEVYGIAYGNNVFVACASSGVTSYIVRSTNYGASWGASLISNPLSSAAVSIAYGNGVFMIAGRTGSTGQVARSTDNGATWSIVKTISTFAPYAITYGDGCFMVVGSTGKLTRSFDDGVTWEADVTPGSFPSSVVALTYGNGVWLASGNIGQVVYSIDNGATWSQALSTPLSLSNLISSGVFTGSNFIIGGAGEISRTLLYTL